MLGRRSRRLDELGRVGSNPKWTQVGRSLRAPAGCSQRTTFWGTTPRTSRLRRRRLGRDVQGCLEDRLPVLDEDRNEITPGPLAAVEGVVDADVELAEHPDVARDQGRLAPVHRVVDRRGHEAGKEGARPGDEVAETGVDLAQ